jgi:hypothetical protein
MLKVIGQQLVDLLAILATKTTTKNRTKKQEAWRKERDGEEKPDSERGRGKTEKPNEGEKPYSERIQQSLSSRLLLITHGPKMKRTKFLSSRNTATSDTRNTSSPENAIKISLISHQNRRPPRVSGTAQRILRNKQKKKRTGEPRAPI